MPAANDVRELGECVACRVVFELTTVADFGSLLPFVSNARGVGLMCALDLPSPELRGRVVRRCFEDGMIVLPCGPRSVRFRPTLSVTAEAIAEGVARLERSIASIAR